MQAISHSTTTTSPDPLTNPETIEAIRWIHSLQNLLGDCETKIYLGEYTTIETPIERVLLHAVFSGIRKLEILGYSDNDYDDLSGK